MEATRAVEELERIAREERRELEEDPTYVPREERARRRGRRRGRGNVAVDHFTRFIDGKAVKDQRAERFVKYFTEFCGRFGAPRRMVSDNAKTFENNAIDVIREQFNTEHQVSPATNTSRNSILPRATGSYRHTRTL